MAGQTSSPWSLPEFWIDMVVELRLCWLVLSEICFFQLWNKNRMKTNDISLL